jgi:hypothetical protein
MRHRLAAELLIRRELAKIYFLQQPLPDLSDSFPSNSLTIVIIWLTRCSLTLSLSFLQQCASSPSVPNPHPIPIPFALLTNPTDPPFPHTPHHRSSPASQYLPCPLFLKSFPTPPPNLPRHLRQRLLLLAHRLRRPIQRLLALLLRRRHQRLPAHLQQLGRAQHPHPRSLLRVPDPQVIQRLYRG